MDSEAGKIELLNSIDLNDAILARMTPAQAVEFTRTYPGLRVRRELILYQLRMSPALMPLSPAKLPSAGAMKMLTVRCFDAVTGGPVSGADIVVVLSRKQGKGIKDVQTDAGGQFTTPLPAGQTRIDAVICTPLAGYWPAQVEGVAVAAQGQTAVDVALPPIARDHRDALDIAISAAEPEDGKGVKIAIIDAERPAHPVSTSSRESTPPARKRPTTGRTTDPATAAMSPASCRAWRRRPSSSSTACSSRALPAPASSPSRAPCARRSRMAATWST